MSSFENPSDPDKEENEKSFEVLRQELVEALLRDNEHDLRVNEESLRALLAWQKAAEKIADAANTSLANIEVMIQRAEIFIEAKRMIFAGHDLADAQVAAENDDSIGEEVLERIKNLQAKL